jgi:hypothetical protein
MRAVLSYVFEILGVLLVGFVLAWNLGWSWGLIPVAVYLLVLGFTVNTTDGGNG